MIRPFGISIEVSCKKVWEKENLENSEHDEQFDEDNLPQSPPDNHRPKPLIVQVKSIFKHHFTAFEYIQKTASKDN